MKTRIQELKTGPNKFVLMITHNNGRREKKRFATRAEAEKAELEYGGTAAALKKALKLGLDKKAAIELIANAALPPISIADTVRLTVATKAMSNRSERYLEHLKCETQRFAEAVGPDKPLQSITSGDVERWLAFQKSRSGGIATPSTRLGILQRISTMFEVAIEKGFLESNPVDRVERPQIVRKESRVFTVLETERLFAMCRPTDMRFLPWLTLSIFAGIRTEELEKLPWTAVRLEEREVVIDASIAKNRRRRVVRLEPIAVRWLQECQRLGEFVFESNFIGVRNEHSVRHAIARHRRRLCERAGVKWSQGVHRNTAATYLFALHADENKVGAMLGCSPKILHAVRSIVPADDCQRFWALSPAAVPNNPIPLPKGGRGIRKPGELSFATPLSQFSEEIR